MRVIEVNMEQRRNEGVGATGEPRENPTTNGIVRHDSHMRKSGVTRPGIERGSSWWELTAQLPWPKSRRRKPLIEVIRDGASGTGKRDSGRDVKELTRAFVRDPSQHSPGVVSGNHGKPKSGWPNSGSNPGPLERESSGLPLRHLARRGGPRENPPTIGDSRKRKSRSYRDGDRTRFALVRGKQANRSANCGPPNRIESIIHTSQEGGELFCPDRNSSPTDILRLDCSPPTKMNRFTPDLSKWKPCRTNPLVGWFSCLVLQVSKRAQHLTFPRGVRLCVKAISSGEVRSSTHEYSVANEVDIPNKWSEIEMASTERLSGFLKTHPSLFQRTAEATSPARATASTDITLRSFTTTWRSFEAHEVWIIDEIGVTTVQRPSKVVAVNGIKHVDAISSRERGELVTLVFALSVSGNSIPPPVRFPRKIYKSHFISSGRPGSIGAATMSGWVTHVEFSQFVQHFVRHTRCSREHPDLLILDNHSSHISFSVMSFCKDNGVVLLSFALHTSRKLQPLDLSVYGPFKKFLNAACD
ncbi:hypothetical protein PR048_007263 [Dryococelus australis]|uniref:DDE-1 domain-containing protein n=1 Tax=Dryococelus australis TaxID=614101 RepID=A0ABQ9ID60_9NEOP|nr:hypothetical protein PR048_007263 [Dryococelus australis]